MLLMLGGDADMWAYLIGPAILGCIVAVVAGGRFRLLALGGAVVLGLGVLVVATMDSGWRTEGGVAVVGWCVLSYTATLAAVDLLIKLTRRDRPSGA